MNNSQIIIFKYWPNQYSTSNNSFLAWCSYIILWSYSFCLLLARGLQGEMLPKFWRQHMHSSFPFKLLMEQVESKDLLGKSMNPPSSNLFLLEQSFNDLFLPDQQGVGIEGRKQLLACSLKNPSIGRHVDWVNRFRLRMKKAARNDLKKHSSWNGRGTIRRGTKHSNLASN